MSKKGEVCDVCCCSQLLRGWSSSSSPRRRWPGAKPPKPPKPPKPDKETYVQLLAINDLHGNLAANTPGTIQTGCCNPVLTAGVQTGWAQQTVPAGGIEYLATHIKALRLTNANTITVGAGDLIGASPLVSALFHDEPTIEAMNAIGLDVTGVGNHEFDEGIDELQAHAVREPARR